MTPKEKAEELIFKYEQYKWINHDLAKQCALICCDEFINDYQWQSHAGIKYWTAVKEEINKL